MYNREWIIVNDHRRTNKNIIDASLGRYYLRNTKLQKQNNKVAGSVIRM